MILKKRWNNQIWTVNPIDHPIPGKFYLTNPLFALSIYDMKKKEYPKELRTLDSGIAVIILDVVDENSSDHCFVKFLYGDKILWSLVARTVFFPVYEIVKDPDDGT